MSGRDVYIGTDGGATTSKVAGRVGRRTRRSRRNCCSGQPTRSGSRRAHEHVGRRDRGLPVDQRPLMERRARCRTGDSRPCTNATACSDTHRTCRRHFAGSTSITATSVRSSARRPLDSAHRRQRRQHGRRRGSAACARRRGEASVMMLAPGSGLGCAYVDRRGLPLDGDTISGMEAAHMPAPLHLLDAKPYTCGCGRTWGCVEMYTTLAGLPYLLAERLDRYPESRTGDVHRKPRSRARSRCAAWRRRAIRWRSRSSTFRRVRSACTSRRCRWRSTRSSS